MFLLRAVVTTVGLTLVTSNALADFCDSLAIGSADTCRANVRANGSVIFGNWLRLKPEQASQTGTGTRGYFTSGTTPAIQTVGAATSRKPMLTIDCFAGKRSIRVDALPYMLGLANGGNKAFNLTFRADFRPPFTESWALDWRHGELKAPEGSRLASELQRAGKLTVMTEGVVGRKSSVGYVFDTQGFDDMISGLCR
ncbi:hypothetical protein [Pseudomonas monteilii]|uniref:hypothetical protein n=1 Tax=Pseudomonas monteilii TaxID=76759 RepID=UPI0036EF4729